MSLNHNAPCLLPPANDHSYISKHLKHLSFTVKTTDLSFFCWILWCTILIKLIENRDKKPRELQILIKAL